jgi:hypothetical protein
MIDLYGDERCRDDVDLRPLKDELERQFELPENANNGAWRWHFDYDTELEAHDGITYILPNYIFGDERAMVVVRVKGLTGRDGGGAYLGVVSPSQEAVSSLLRRYVECPRKFREWGN